MSNLLGEKEALDDVKSVDRLLAQNASAGARADIGQRLEAPPGRSGERVIRGLRERISEMDQEPGTMRRSFEDCWRAPCATSLRRFPTAIAIRSWSLCARCGSRHFACCNSFETACRIARCGVGVPLRTTRPRSMSSSPAAQRQNRPGVR